MKRNFIIYLALYSINSAATEFGGSNYLPGFYGDFAMAQLPDHGTYFNNFFAAYQDINGDTGTLLEMPGVMHISEYKILDGHFVAGIYPGVLASKDHTGSNSFERVGLGDFYIQPAGMSWNYEKFSAMLFEGIVAPTGRYEKGDFNTGRNYWTFDHNLLLTWRLPLDTEVSLGLGYMNNTKNPATDYHSGDEFHLDYTAAYYFSPSVGLGIAGSYYQQVDKDTAPGDTVIADSGEASTLGPAILYTPKINNEDITISLKWLREFNVSGRLPQEYLICRLFMSF